MKAEALNLYGLIAVIVQSVTSLAWPAAFLIAVWLFREKLNELLPLFRVKYKDFDAFFFSLEKAEKEAAALPKTPQNQEAEAKPTPEEVNRFEEIASNSPGLAIMEARNQLDDAIWSLATATGVVGKPPRSSETTVLVRKLRERGTIDAPLSALLTNLLALTSETARGRYATRDEALRIGKLTTEAVMQLATTELLLETASAAGKMRGAEAPLMACRTTPVLSMPMQATPIDCRQHISSAPGARACTGHAKPHHLSPRFHRPQASGDGALMDAPAASKLPLYLRAGSRPHLHQDFPQTCVTLAPLHGRRRRPRTGCSRVPTSRGVAMA